jgi:hypothetical protein
MARRDQSRLVTRALRGTMALTAGFSTILFCGSSNAAEPTSQPATLLQQLSVDTQRLYVQARHSIVRVRLPTPQWLEQFNSRQEFIRKWGPVMDPAVRQKIMDEQDRALSDLHHAPTTSPTTAPIGEMHVAETAKPGESSLALYVVGMLVDDSGHVVFPAFVDKKYVGDAALPAITGDGQITMAKFIGSDKKTNLTVLQLENHTGIPAPLGHTRPDDGVLALAIAPDGGARLVVWNNHLPDAGFAILADGSVAGFGFAGHFLGASVAKPIVDQLISTGEVHRAVLGVLTVEVGRDDPIRRQRAELGTSPAIRIVAVQDKSPAAVGGVCKDDLVLSVDDQSVGDLPTFAALIATRRGDTTLQVLRGSQIIRLTVNMQPN